MSPRGRVAICAGVVVLVGAGATTYALTRDTAAASNERAAVKLATTTIQQQDVVTYDETTATLGFTGSATVSSPVTGTVTTIVSDGDIVDAGTVVATIDGAPVVALIGDVPAYRDLSTSSSNGVDVRQLEQNLVALGFDPDHDIVIDEDFDSHTAAAVTRWEDSLGLDGDGKVPQSEMVFIGGQVLVDSVDVNVGGAASAGSSLVSGRQSERRFLVSVPGGTVSKFAAAGTDVVTGTVLMADNGLPVVAIEGDQSAEPALQRDLSVGVDDGADVKLLERMLVAGGFDPEATMTVDDHFDDATAAAVLRWWQSYDANIAVADTNSLIVPAGSFVVVPSGLQIGTAFAADGAALAGPAVVLTLTSPARVVSTTAPINDDTFALGATIDVEFPDGTIQPGTVVKVGNVAANTGGNPGDTPTVSIDIHVDGIPASVDSFVSIPVTLRVVDQSVPGAFVVPVSALVALAEGGYAVEVVDGTDASGKEITHLIAVEPGLFSDGFVVITGSDVAAGLNVVVPS